jgi:hypothetical protein
MTECERSVSGGVVGAWGRWGGGNPVVSRCSTTGYRSAPLWDEEAGEGERTVLTGLTGLTEWTRVHGRDGRDGWDGLLGDGWLGERACRRTPCAGRAVMLPAVQSLRRDEGI